MAIPNVPSRTADPARPRLEMHFRPHYKRRSEAEPRLGRTAPERMLCRKSRTTLFPVAQVRGGCVSCGDETGIKSSEVTNVVNESIRNLPARGVLRLQCYLEFREGWRVEVSLIA